MNDPNIKIIRLGRSGNNLNVFERYIGYLVFYVGTLLGLVTNLPRKILYYETISFFPVYLYKRFIKKSAGIWAHYHEYTTPKEYEKGMLLSRKFHVLEKRMYKDMDGLSHTNEYRMSFFLKDTSPITPLSTNIFPNFPPRKWYDTIKRSTSVVIRIVYIGSLSMDTMYTREMAAWVLAQDGKVTWDIYSFNFSPGAKAYLSALNTSIIRLKEGVNYESLPTILGNYDIGVILYTGHIPNYVYNAPNKLFEYLGAGLQVWIPDSLVGAFPYLEANEHPRVLALDFKTLSKMCYKDIVLGERNSASKIYCAEEVYKPLLKYLSG